jgi:hypothetical protein
VGEELTNTIVHFLFLRHVGCLHAPTRAMNIFGWVPTVFKPDMDQGIFDLIDKNDLKGTLNPPP